MTPLVGKHHTQSRPWSGSDLEVLDSDLSDAEAAKKLKRSLTSVTVKRRRRRAANRGPKRLPGDSTVEQDVSEKTETFWKRQYHLLSSKYEKLSEKQGVVDQLVADIKEAAPRSYSSAPAVKAPRKNSGKPQSAVLLLSDTHVGKEVVPEQTLGFGQYNFDVFLSRLKYLEESVVSILHDHTTTQVPELVIPMLGDMLDGALLHNVEAGQVTTLFSQFYGAGHALAQFLRNLAPHVPKIRIYTAVGNHTRWANQKRMPTHNRYSNLDSFCYALIEALTRDIGNIEWDFNTQPFSTFTVQGFFFHASHGDHLRGGDKALGIPNHAVGRAVSSTTQLYNKISAPAPHYYVVGHLHREISLPHTTGEVLVNGGFVGLDGYSLAEGFSAVDPSQRLFLVHPLYGKTASY